MNKLFKDKLDAYYAAGGAVIAYIEGCEFKKVKISNSFGYTDVRYDFQWVLNRNGAVKQKSKRKWIEMKIAGLISELHFLSVVIENPSLFEIKTKDALEYRAYLKDEYLEIMISVFKAYGKVIKGKDRDRFYSLVHMESIELISGRNHKCGYGEYVNTVLLVEKHWKLIEAVANELLKRKTLTGEEVEEIIKSMSNKK